VLDPDQLRLLQTVARTGSYSAAARELGYTQPAISYRMRRLEQSVGGPLAVRRGRLMQLTPAGEILLQHADRILAAVAAAERAVTAMSGTPSGPVRLAAFPSSCASLVPAAIMAMRRAHPEVEVQLVQAEFPESRDLVRRGEVDVALGYHFGPCEHGRDDASALARVPITVDEVSLVLPADHALAHRRVIGIEDLRADTWIIASTAFHDMLQRAAAAFDFAPKIMKVADDYVTMQGLVAHGLGIALIPGLALGVHRDSRIVPRTLRDWPSRHIEAEVWPDLLRVEAVRTLVSRLVGAANATQR
jgi:DNA-binding transcriptional LysR family regulator